MLRTSDDTDAMTLAAVHPYGHEEPLEISRTEFESFVRKGLYFEEDTLEEQPLDEVVEGVNRDLMKSFLVYQASAEEHRSLRRIVGKSQFLAPQRPDIAFGTNRLARSLACPSKSDIIASNRFL